MKIEEYLKFYKITWIQFARDLGVSSGHIRLIKNKKRKPSLELAKKIEIMTGGMITVQELRGEKRDEED